MKTLPTKAVFNKTSLQELKDEFESIETQLKQAKEQNRKFENFINNLSTVITFADKDVFEENVFLYLDKNSTSNNKPILSAKR